jgi:hypothetical protein
MTVWKPVPGFRYYSVSDGGEVRSVAKSATGRLVAGEIVKGGYVRVRLVDSTLGKDRRFFVNRLVLWVFDSEGFFIGAEAAHLDGNPANNKLLNLKWSSKKENASHRIAHGTHPGGEKNPAAKLNLSQVNQIRRKLSRGCSGRALAREFGVDKATIYNIKHRRNW